MPRLGIPRASRAPPRCTSLAKAVEKNQIAAIYANYKKATDAGDWNGLLILGILTETGQGTAKDEVAAARMYRTNVDRGDFIAQTYLARMIETGQGGLKADQRLCWSSVCSCGCLTGYHRFTLTCPRTTGSPLFLSQRDSSQALQGS
jgi:TPR repeat protein